MDLLNQCAHPLTPTARWPAAAAVSVLFFDGQLNRKCLHYCASPARRAQMRHIAVDIARNVARVSSARESVAAEFVLWDVQKQLKQSRCISAHPA